MSSCSLAEPVHSELIVRKSRFLGCVQPMGSRAEALKAVDDLRRDHPAATHICWALLAGGEGAAVDDGEPSGTAGRPMLEVLRRQNLDGVLATVVRYFGGVKLGAGGLVRAYTDAVAQALVAARKVPIERQLDLCCRVPYDLEGRMRRELAQAGATFNEVKHEAVVTMDFRVAEPAVSHLKLAMDEWGGGRIVWLGQWKCQP